MSDSIEITWKVNAMDCYPTLSGEKDYVFNVHWDCLSYYSGISGGPLYGRTFSVTKMPETTGDFIQYTGLNEEMVLSWVWEVIGPETKNDYEQKSCIEIYNQLNPPVVQLPLPWIKNDINS